MRNLSERLRLPKGKSLFISAAIATLLAQPINLTIGSANTYAATNPSNPTTTLNEEALVEASVTVATDQQHDGSYPDSTQVRGEVLGLEDEKEYKLTHQFTISRDGSELYTTEPESSQSNSHTITLDTQSHREGEYAISYTVSYQEVNEDISVTVNLENSTSITVMFLPTATIEAPSQATESSFAYRVTAKPQIDSDYISSISARIFNADETLVEDSDRLEEYSLKENGQRTADFSSGTLDDGDYYIEYKTEARNLQDDSTVKESETYKYFFSVNTSTDPPVEPEEPIDPADPIDPEGPATPEPEPTEPTEQETPITPAEPEEELGPEDEESEDDEDKDDIEDTLLGAATFSTGLVGNADPFFTEIIGGPTIALENNNQNQDSEDEGSTSSTSTKPEVDERGVVQFLGISWYWWVAMLAGATSIWSLVIAGRNRMTEGGL